MNSINHHLDLSLNENFKHKKVKKNKKKHTVTNDAFLGTLFRGRRLIIYLLSIAKRLLILLKIAKLLM